MKYAENPKWKKVRLYNSISGGLVLFLPAAISIYIQNKNNITQDELMSDIHPAVLVIWGLLITIIGVIHIYANYKDPSNIKNRWNRVLYLLKNTDKETSFNIWKMMNSECPHCFKKLPSRFASKCPYCTAEI